MRPKPTQVSATKVKRVIGSVKAGVYIPAATDQDISQPREHSLHRQYVRDRMREDYGRDLVQPYKNGRVNEEFVEAWGKDDEQVKYITNEQTR